jgi:hypothetical protein
VESDSHFSIKQEPSLEDIPLMSKAGSQTEKSCYVVDKNILSESAQRFLAVELCRWVMSLVMSVIYERGNQ